MKALTIVLILLGIVSCSTTRELENIDIVGEYRWVSIFEIVSVIEFKEDYTFQYYWQVGLISGKTIGTWKLDKKTIILNSEKQPSTKPISNFELVKTVRENSDTLSIKLVNPNYETIPFANCVLKLDTSILAIAETDFRGIANFPQINVDSLIISYVGFKTIRYLLNSELYHYQFIMKEKNRNYKFFVNEKWKYKKGRLYDLSRQRSKYDEMKYY